MKHFLKGAAITVVVLLVSMAIQVFCNMNGVQIDLTVSGPVTAACAMLIYHALIRDEKK